MYDRICQNEKLADPLTFASSVCVLVGKLVAHFCSQTMKEDRTLASTGLVPKRFFCKANEQGSNGQPPAQIIANKK